MKSIHAMKSTEHDYSTKQNITKGSDISQIDTLRFRILTECWARWLGVWQTRVNLH